MKSAPDKPRVSILLATYRSEDFFSRQLAGLAAQSIWNDADLVIIANDPSTTELTAMEQFHARWPYGVQLIVVGRETLYASWNRGANSARADLLAIANVDDVRTSAGLEAQASCLEESPDAFFCYGPFQVVRRVGDTPARMIYPPEFDALEFTRSMHAGPFFVWRRQPEDLNLCFDEQFRSGGDFDFVVRLSRLGRGVRVEETLGTYFDGGVGLSTGSRLQPIERTAIELRYGIYDKLDYDYLPEALEYNIANLYWGGVWHPVSACVPDYESWISARRQRWFQEGIRHYCKRTALGQPRHTIDTALSLLKSGLRSMRRGKGGTG